MGSETFIFFADAYISSDSLGGAAVPCLAPHMHFKQMVSWDLRSALYMSDSTCLCSSDGLASQLWRQIDLSMIIKIRIECDYKNVVNVYCHVCMVQ